MIHRRQWLQMLAVAALPAAVWAQQQRTPQNRDSRQGRQGSGNKATGAGGKSPEDLLIRFPGTLKNVSRKQILLEVENEQDVIFRRTKRTQFFNGDKLAQEEAAPVGEKIVIEGQRALNGDLDAINIIWNEKPPAKEQ